MKKIRRYYRGKWAGQHTAVTIAKLMGTHPSKAKRVLSGIVEHYGEIVFQDTPEAADIIGMAIQEVRNRDELKRIKKLIRD